MRRSFSLLTVTGLPTPRPIGEFLLGTLPWAGECPGTSNVIKVINPRSRLLTAR